MLDARASVYTRLTPPPAVASWRWAEQSIVIPAGVATVAPGPYRQDFAPYGRGIMEALDDPSVSCVVVEAGAQTGKTTLGLVWLMTRCALAPGPMLVAMASEDQARRCSQERVMPVFEASPGLSPMIPATRRRQRWCALSYQLIPCTWAWAGARTPAQLASRPIRYLLLDEVDKFPPRAGDEADPISLAEQRTKTYMHVRKVILTSTPSGPDGAINSRYLLGDCRRYEVPCRACGRMQPLVWAQVRFDSDLEPSDAAAGAWYECSFGDCKARWDDTDKRAAVRRGEWRATKAAAERGVVSFRLPSLASPIVTWSYLVTRFLRSKGNPLYLQDFVNSELAEPWEEASRHATSETILAREGMYESGQRFASHPAYASRYAGKRPIVLGGVDVQQDVLYAVAREYVAEGDSGQVARASVGTWAELADFLGRHDVQACCIDAAYRTDEVYRFCAAQPGCWPCVGVAGFRVPALWERQDRIPSEGRRGQKRGASMAVIVANADAFGAMLVQRMMQPENGGMPAWYVPRGAAGDEAYCRQMCAPRQLGKKVVTPKGRDDHYFDAEKLSLVAAEVIGANP